MHSNVTYIAKYMAFFTGLLLLQTKLPHAGMVVRSFSDTLSAERMADGLQNHFQNFLRGFSSDVLAPCSSTSNYVTTR